MGAPWGAEENELLIGLASLQLDSNVAAVAIGQKDKARTKSFDRSRFKVIPRETRGQAAARRAREAKEAQVNAAPKKRQAPQAPPSGDTTGFYTASAPAHSDAGATDPRTNATTISAVATGDGRTRRTYAGCDATSATASLRDGTRGSGDRPWPLQAAGGNGEGPSRRH